MILDKENLLSDSQAITVTAGSENVIDMGADSDRIQEFVEKAGELFCQVDADFAGGDDLQVVVQTDDDVAFGSATTVYSTAAIPVADLVAGYQFRLAQLPPHTSERYLRFNYVVTGAGLSGGSVVAGVVLDKQTNGA